MKWTYNSFTLSKPADTSAEPTPAPTLPADDPEYTDPGEDDFDGLITKQLVYIDDDIKLGGGVLSQNGAFEFLNWTCGTITTELKNKDIFKTYQTKESKWGQRLRLSSPSQIALDSKTVFKIRFKCTADNYNVTLPRAQVMFDTNGITQYVMQFNGSVSVLSPTKKDVWRTLLYTIDPKNGTITGTMDGETVSSAQITNTEADTISQASFEFAVSDTDNGNITTPVTWQVDKIEVYQRRAPEAPAEPLNTAVESGAWESTEYESGCGADDSTQLTGTVVDLDGKYIINKVTVDHDSSDIMSWSVMTSEDGVNYTRVSNVYAGGVDKYSGKQTIRFAPETARYVKYSAVLIGNHYTKARLNNMKIEYTEPVSIAFIDLPELYGTRVSQI